MAQCRHWRLQATGHRLGVLHIEEGATATFVLVIFVLASREPVGVTSVPGYRSLNECWTAGHEMDGVVRPATATDADRNAVERGLDLGHIAR
jgi:hypothetical protein